MNKSQFLDISYQITDLTLNYIVQIEKFITQTELNLFKQTKTFSNNKFQNQILEEIHSISVFFSLNKNIHVIKKLIKGQQLPTDKSEQIILNIKNVFEYMLKNSNKNRNLEFYEIIHIVKILQNNVLEDWQLGIIRESNQEIANNFLELNKNHIASINMNISFTHLLANLIRTINEESSIHPIIKGAIILYVIQQLYPFLGLNYLSSLILFKWILIKSYGYEISIQIPILKILDFINLNNSISNNGDNNQTLSMLIEKLAFSLLKLINIYSNNLSLNIESKKEIYLNERQKIFLKYLSKSNETKITRQKYVKMFNISFMTAYRDLQDLAKKGIIFRYGEKKSTYYSTYIQQKN